MKKNVAQKGGAGRISIRGARQNNLKNISLDIPLGEFTVVTGVSGSGKSSLVFDTVYAEGQRRYIETFSPYARQFLERMDPPDVDAVSGIPPAVAIRQTNPVRTSRSTVGTMTELNDHLKLLFARRARLHCGGCGRVVEADTVQSVMRKLSESGLDGRRLTVGFCAPAPPGMAWDEIAALLSAQGYRRFALEGAAVRVDLDSFIYGASKRKRAAESIAAAFEKGKGEITLREDGAPGGAERKFSNRLHCPYCGIGYAPATPNTFSFNSAAGACETCRGFGRVIAFSEALVVPDAAKSVAGGAIKPFQTKSFAECQRDIMKYGKRAGFPLGAPWRDLTDAQRDWVMQGEGGWDSGKWWGVKRFFDWLESRAYKMHVRVLLSRYREYRVCPACGGARLKPAAQNWKITGADGRERSIRDIMLAPVSEALALFTEMRGGARAKDELLIFDEIIPRLSYLCEAGLGYLNLDRQSRTLSGGEVQRINLTQALGSSLINTLFVLDEPSVGLHPRDAGRLAGILRRLRDAGNTPLVVEHDPAVIAAADRVIELGPGPGERGGEIIYNGAPGACPSLKAAQAHDRRRRPGAPRGVIRVKGAREHNLKNITVDFPLGRLTVVTGVSGSGKSTLVNDVLAANAKSALGAAVEWRGECDGVEGLEGVSSVELVDQSPIGKTTRSTPASFTGAFDAVRRVFAASPAAAARGYGYGDFSFNSGAGRCPDCEGSGYEMIEMQFLSDVYLKCEKCGGARYTREILDVKIPWQGAHGATGGASIADVLSMTVEEAAAGFAGNAAAADALRPLIDAGLGYLRMGQPVPTLSGGEAQRLKLAGHLARHGAAGRRKKGAGAALFIFDEPTTGLHSADVSALLRVLHRLVDDGGTVIVIEHNLQVIRSADHIIDLGPEGGDAGGRIVCTGAPEEVARAGLGWTAAALNGALEPGGKRKARAAAGSKAAPRRDCIRVRGATEHNLRSVDADLPLGKFSVITGVSGSGKSTLAFDILFASGQRRYLECLNAYARQFAQPQAKPAALSISNLPPTVAIEQRLSRGGWKSTVATVTEVFSGLRLLYLTLARQHCPGCGREVRKQTPEQILSLVLSRHGGRRVEFLSRLVAGRKGLYKDLAAKAKKDGVERLRVDGAWTPVDKWPALAKYKTHDIDAPAGAFTAAPGAAKEILSGVKAALSAGGGVMRIIADGAEYAVSTARACPDCGVSFEEPDPRLFSFNSHIGRCPECEGYGVELERRGAREPDEQGRAKSFAEISGDDALEGAHEAHACPACGGARLNPVALGYKFHGLDIAEMCAMTVSGARAYFAALALSGREAAVAGRVVADIAARLGFLEDAGLGYVSLGRAAPTLSGGEGQRIRLAAQLASNLSGVCYILDEPTIGLHPRDTGLLLDSLERLRDKGNTVLVVEHDEQTMRRADHILDMGPGAGVEGGRVVAEGTLAQIMKSGASRTARILREPPAHPLLGARRDCAKAPKLEIRRASLRNLKNITVKIPLGRWTVVTGVSGSGKSTLVRDVMHANAKAALAAEGGPAPAPYGCAKIKGLEKIKRVIEVDQSPIGRTPRSCPATYIGFMDEIRRLYAALPESRLRAWDASRFSFNVAGGRCPECEGQGVVRVGMSFLPDVTDECPLCGGARYNPETLGAKYDGMDIAQALRLSCREAAARFERHPRIRGALMLMDAVGLGYLTLGQRSSTLSGGEAQRIKLVTELARCSAIEAGRAPATLYILDEPTVGLHGADVENLVKVTHRLVDAGHTVVMIEHNMDMVSEADWVIDLGPGGGDEGGEITAQGAPEDIARAGGWTAEALRAHAAAQDAARRAGKVDKRRRANV